MTSAAADDAQLSRGQCWCCGAMEDPGRVVRLGNHPEVALCLRCARWASQQARAIEDAAKTGLQVRARERLRSARRTVIQRGWHHNRILGPFLRWLGRYLP